MQLKKSWVIPQKGGLRQLGWDIHNFVIFYLPDVDKLLWDALSMFYTGNHVEDYVIQMLDFNRCLYRKQKKNALSIVPLPLFVIGSIF